VRGLKVPKIDWLKVVKEIDPGLFPRMYQFADKHMRIEIPKWLNKFENSAMFVLYSHKKTKHFPWAEKFPQVSSTESPMKHYTKGISFCAA
jgi:hypothetical protein